MKRIRIFAILFAVITAAAVYIYLSGIKKPETVRRVPVVVAAADIREGDVITDSMLEVRQIPEEAVVPGAATNKYEAEGLVCGRAVNKGEQVLSGMLFKPGEAGGSLALAVDKGMRAYTVQVDCVSGVGFLIKPHDNVDVLLIIGIADAAASSAQGTPVTRTYSRILLQDVRVLAVNQQMLPSGNTAKSEAADKNTVTLSITPEQAVTLNLAQAEGVLSLMLRSPLDTATVDADQAGVSNLVK